LKTKAPFTIATAVRGAKALRAVYGDNVAIELDLKTGVVRCVPTASREAELGEGNPWDEAAR